MKYTPVYTCLNHNKKKKAIVPIFKARRWDNSVVNYYGFMCGKCAEPYVVIWV